MSKPEHRLESVHNHLMSEDEAQNSRTGKRRSVPPRTQVSLGHQPKRGFTKKSAGGPPAPPQPSRPDSKQRDQKLPEKAEQAQNYTKKKGYGQIPKYLQQRKAETQRAQEEFDTSVEEQKRRYDDERQTILKLLTEKHSELIREHQALPIVSDSPARQARRERLERLLTQLADDIDRYERLKPSKVYKD